MYHQGRQNRNCHWHNWNPRRNKYSGWWNSGIAWEPRIDVNDVGRVKPNPAGSIGKISLEQYNSPFSCPAYQPGRVMPRNYDFDCVVPIIEAHRYGKATEKYWGVTSDPYEKVIMTNRPENEVFAIDPEYGTTPIWKFGGYESGLNRPTGICYDPFGSRIFVADKDNHRMVILSKDGQFITHFGQEGRDKGSFSYPWDVDVSPDGNQIAVTDSRNHRIQFFDKFGHYLSNYSTRSDCRYDYRSDINYPRGITYDRSGFGLNEKTVFVSDFNYETVFRINTRTLRCTEVHVRDLKRPQGIAMDGVGNLVVCDTKDHCLRVINQQGFMNSVVKTVGRRELDTPTDICFLKGAILVMDMDGKVGVF